MRTQEPGPRLLRARDAAGLLHISESTIRRLTRTGHIKPIRIGRSVRYHPDELARYLERNQRAA